MEVPLKPELEAKLARIAAQNGRASEQVIEELVEKFVDHDQWFKQEVEKGLAELDRGEFIEHDEVVARIEKMFRT